jgi:transcriptional regulator with PAS, ATPase and Fis domain
LHTPSFLKAAEQTRWESDSRFSITLVAFVVEATMYGREKRVLLREYLEQGWSKSALAEKLGISRRSVYHWIGTGQLECDMDAEAVRSPSGHR